MKTRHWYTAASQQYGSLRAAMRAARVAALAFGADRPGGFIVERRNEHGDSWAICGYRWDLDRHRVVKVVAG